MKQGAQGEKGHAYERVIGALFTEVYYPEGSGEFKRVPQSGGWDKRVVSGDLMALKRVSNDSDEMIIDRSFPFSIECKNWKDVSHFFKGLYANESELFAWMEQASNDAAAAEKIPLVVFKLWRQSHVAMLNSYGWHRVRELFGEFPGKYYSMDRVTPGEIQLGDFWLCLLTDFLEHIDWEVFKFSGKAKFIRSIVKKDG